MRLQHLSMTAALLLFSGVTALPGVDTNVTANSTETTPRVGRDALRANLRNATRLPDGRVRQQEDEESTNGVPKNSSAAVPAVAAVNSTTSNMTEVAVSVNGTAKQWGNQGNPGTPYANDFQGSDLQPVQPVSNNNYDFFLMGDFQPVNDPGQSPQNFRSMGGNRFSLSVKPYQEAVRVQSAKWFMGGKFEFKCRTASTMPGIITSVYLASEKGKNSETGMSTQDEIDLEWKGNTPQEVQTNVFVLGQDQPQVSDLGFDTSTTDAIYTIDWDATTVRMSVNGQLIRTIQLWRPLRPMQLTMSVWSTMGGWDGLVRWAGSPDWNKHGNSPITAYFEILTMPSNVQ